MKPTTSDIPRGKTTTDKPSKLANAADSRYKQVGYHCSVERRFSKGQNLSYKCPIVLNLRTYLGLAHTFVISRRLLRDHHKSGLKISPKLQIKRNF